MSRTRTIIATGLVALMAGCGGDTAGVEDIAADVADSTVEDTEAPLEDTEAPLEDTAVLPEDAAPDVDDDVDTAPEDTLAPEDTVGPEDTSLSPDGDTEDSDADAVVCVPVAADDATLDGVDDDCDGLIDEDVAVPEVPGPDPIELRLDPDLAFVGDTVTVSVVARVTAGAAPSSVTLERLAADGTATVVLEIPDVLPDGVGNVGPDGVYEVGFALDTSAPSHDRYRVVAATADGDLAAEPQAVTVLAPLPDGWLDDIWDVMEEASDELAAERALWPEAETLTRAAERLRMQPGVVTAKADADTGAVTVLFEPGVVAALGTVGDGLRSGVDDVVGPPEPGPVEIGDRDALLLRMWDFVSDETVDIENAFAATPDCRPALSVNRKDRPDSMLNLFLHLSDFALVHIQTHGVLISLLGEDIWEESLCEAAGYPRDSTACEVYKAFLDDRRWAEQEALIVFDHVQRGDGLSPARRRDLLTGRLGLYFDPVRDPLAPDVHGLEFLLFGDFIEHYNAPFPNSIVFGGFCESLHTGTMANAFLRRGAGAYLGYNNTVPDAFAKRSAAGFYSCLAADPGRTVGDCFVPGQGGYLGSDYVAPWALFLMVGDPNVRLARPDLGNGSFEGAYHLRAVRWDDDPAQGWRSAFWTGNNSLRVRESYGVHEPVDGEHLGVVGNFGPGSTGRFEQELCLPPGTQAITASYAIYTSDCHPGKADLVQGTVIVGEGADAAQVSLFNRNLRYDKACATLDFSPVEGMVYADGSQPSATPWMEASADVSALTTGDACVPAKLYFTVLDRQYQPPSYYPIGSAGDTALVLDDIRVVGGEVCEATELAFLQDLSGPPCTVDASLGAVTGQQVCLGPGAYHCAGDAPVPEVCDWVDNDHNGAIDELSSCPTGPNCTPGPYCTTPFCLAQLCNDYDPCTTETCDPVLGCVFTLRHGVSCDDFEQCTTGDSCRLGHCVGLPADISCDDHKQCTTDDHCENGWCKSTLAVGPCDDGHACTGTDYCDLYGHCSGVPISGPCDDHKACTANDACTTWGSCSGTPIEGCTP